MVRNEKFLPGQRHFPSEADTLLAGRLLGQVMFFHATSPSVRNVLALQTDTSYAIFRLMADFSNVFIRVERKDIYYVRFILEGYDGLGSVTTKDPVKGLLIITYPNDSRYDILELIKALQDEGIVKEVGES
jgi:hypothetical protein